MWRGGRGIKGDRESNELSKESLGFSLYIFCDACDLKIKSNLSPQGFSVCSSDAQKDTAHLAGWKALTLPSKSPVWRLRFLFAPRSTILIWEDCVQRWRLNTAYVVR